MILINLLPYREERRKRRKQAFFAGMGLAAILGALIVAIIFLLLQYLTIEQQRRNQYLRSETEKLELQIRDIANLRAEIDALKARQKAVEDLQTDRNTPVHMLNDLAKYVPEGIYLTAIKQNEKVVNLTGIAQTNERVSEFMRNVQREAEWLERPELNEIKLANLSAGGRDQKRLFEFTMQVSIKAPSAADAPGPKASGAPAPAASGNRS
ncbi:MAG: PilN domain-containing protein [Paucibacter sp.]|nr:PilN domain-containing protein [Roseateles sp.]